MTVLLELEKNRKPYGKLYGKYRASLAADDDMLAERLEADCKALAEEIRAYEGVAAQLRAKLAAKNLATLLNTIWKVTVSRHLDGPGAEHPSVG